MLCVTFCDYVLILISVFDLLVDAIYGLKKGLITVAIHNLVAHLANILVPLAFCLGKLQE